MKKFTSSDLGGAPIYKNDLRDIFNSEIWDAMQAIFSPYDSDTQGMIVSGCVITGSNPYNISTGIVYLDGEFKRLPAQTGVTLPKYIASKAIVNDTRVFADSSSHVVAVTKDAELVASAPVSGQYVAITTTTDSDDRRYSNSINNTKTIIVTNWDMDTTSSYSIAHGLLDSKILDISVIIQDSVLGKYYPLTIANPSTGLCSGYIIINTTSIEMNRFDSGIFDNSAYVNTNIKIFITYQH